MRAEAEAEAVGRMAMGAGQQVVISEEGAEAAEAREATEATF